MSRGPRRAGEPLRDVLLWEAHGRHLLECGHLRRFRFTAYGPTYPARARCADCGRGLAQLDGQALAARVLAEMEAGPLPSSYDFFEGRGGWAGWRLAGRPRPLPREGWTFQLPREVEAALPPLPPATSSRSRGTPG